MGEGERGREAGTKVGDGRDNGEKGERKGEIPLQPLVN